MARAVGGRARRPGAGRSPVRAAAVTLAALATLTAATAAAQPPAEAEAAEAADVVSPFLPPTHWAVAAVRRAEALGLLDDALPARRELPRALVGRALRQAWRRGAEQAPAHAALMAGWYARFAEEFREAEAERRGELPSVQPLGAAAFAGYEYADGRVAPGLGERGEERTGALPLPDVSGARVGAALGVRVGGVVAVEVEPAWSADGVELARADLLAGWGPVYVAAGRQAIGYGPGIGGGVVLGGAARVDRLEVGTNRTVRLPRGLRWLGPASFHSFMARTNEGRHPGEPYLWGASGTLRPHPRLTLAVHRAALFGGERASPITLRRLLSMLIGEVRGSVFEDQVVAAEGRLRLPTEALLPLTLYLEWGSEDAAGAWFDVPGRVVGAYVPSLPGAPAAALGVEYSRFRPSCCGNPPWYRHSLFPGSWALDEVPLGHALGGHGSELLLYGEVAPLAARLRLAGRAFRRERERENLFAPERVGISHGGRVEAWWRVGARQELTVEFFREAGDGWSEARAGAGLRLFF